MSFIKYRAKLRAGDIAEDTDLARLRARVGPTAQIERVLVTETFRTVPVVVEPIPLTRDEIVITEVEQGAA